VIYPPLDHPAWLVAAFLIGACVGSFLNVVIYRLPLGLSVNDPKRSFCPKCKSPIPMRRNVPLLSWLLLRGRCADCKAPISVRYFLVELLTALLFAATAWVVVGRVGPQGGIGVLALLPLWFMVASFIAIAFIDAEHMIIPLELTISGTVAGFLAALAMPVLPDLVGWSAGGGGQWWSGLWQALLGAVIGFFGLWAVVLLGKLAFGRKEMKFDEPVAWRLIEPEGDEDPILFEMGDERIEWWDLFNRPSDRLILEAASLRVDGEARDGGTLIVREQRIELPDGEKIDLEKIRSLDGTSAHAVIPREAMGMGDVHLMGMIGAFFGWTGVFFSLFASSMLAIVAALLCRVGFGRPLPYGPFLVLGALIWFFGGWKLAAWYLELLR
jgi:leader peptidase (prepilin peptidase)/N-methyltransferase